MEQNQYEGMIKGFNKQINLMVEIDKKLRKINNNLNVIGVLVLLAFLGSILGSCGLY